MASRPIIQSAEQLHAVVDDWFDEKLRRAPLAHDVAVYNQAVEARDDLKGRISKLFGEPAATSQAEPEIAAPATTGSAKAKATD